MKIAVLGAGAVGSTIGRLWHAAGHDVTFTARHATRPRALAAELVNCIASLQQDEEDDSFGPAVRYDLKSHRPPQLAPRDLVGLANGQPVSALEIRCMPITVRDCSGMARA